MGLFKISSLLFSSLLLLFTLTLLTLLVLQSILLISLITLSNTKGDSKKGCSSTGTLRTLCMYVAWLLSHSNSSSIVTLYGTLSLSRSCLARLEEKGGKA